MVAAADWAGFLSIKAAFGPGMPTLEASTAPVPRGMDVFRFGRRFLRGTLLSVVVVAVVVAIEVVAAVAVPGCSGPIACFCNIPW